MSLRGERVGYLHVSPFDQASLRQKVLGWSVGQAVPGESSADTIGRATEYLEFILYPLRSDVAEATAERGASTLH